MTPNAGDGLATAASAWPTPDAILANDGEDPETWLARRARLKDTARNGNGAGIPLAMAAILWPTPKASAAKMGLPRANDQGDLQAAAVAWPTPTANCSTGAGTEGRDGGSNLQTMANGWAWPTARDHKDGSCAESQTPTNALLGRQAARWEHSRPDLATGKAGDTSYRTVPTSRPRLNPAFVEWLMGWPEGWANPCHPVASCSYHSWETVSCLLLRHWLSSFSSDGYLLNCDGDGQLNLDFG